MKLRYQTSQALLTSALRTIPLGMRIFTLRRPRQARVHDVLVHRVGNCLSSSGEHLMPAMLAIEQVGLVSNPGVSVYDGAQINAKSIRYEVDLTQLPSTCLTRAYLRADV